jgi:hypothetical protein
LVTTKADSVTSLPWFPRTFGSQLGDPGKVVAALIKLVDDPAPPANLFLGSDALDRAGKKIQQLLDQMKEWKAVSLSTDF